MAHPGEVGIVAPQARDDSLSLSSEMLRSSVASPTYRVVEEAATDAPSAGAVPSAPPAAQQPARTDSPPPSTKGGGGHPLHNAVHPMQPAPPNEAAPEADGRIDDLLGMLECPICLDTADRPPIYQCPEGHLLCEDCNSRLVDCPQCGHALMNSRNRTAEDLAEKLQSLRGRRRDEHAPNQSVLSITVSEPQKLRKGLFSHVVYQINTTVVGSEITTTATTASYRVTRRYSEIINLYHKLVKDYQTGGVIVPPPPAKNRLASVAVKLGTTTTSGDLGESLTSQMFEKRCLALDRYFKRLAKHPTIRKDPNFRAFVQENELPKALGQSKTFSEKVTEFKDRMSIFQTKFTVTEHDPWFQTRQAQLNAMSNQVKDMQTNLKDMTDLKLKLCEATDSFQRGLVSMSVSGSGNISRATTMTSGGGGGSSIRLGLVIHEVVECHKAMAGIHQEQSKADELILQLAVDYEKLVSSAKDVLSSRRKYQQQMQKVRKGKNPLEAIEKIQKEFDILSQTIRRELEHFDFVMREEFEEAFTAYNSRYWRSLRKSTKQAEAN